MYYNPENLNKSSKSSKSSKPSIQAWSHQVSNAFIPTTLSCHASNEEASEPSEVVKIPQIARELDKMDKTITELGLIIAELGVKLSPILEETPEIAQPSNPKPYLVPIAGNIYDLNEQVLYLINKLQSIINHIEV